jgi:flagellar biosynthetic protein FliR
MTLEALALAWLYPTLLVFVRLGAALLLLPGFSERFVSPRIRLLFALVLAFGLAPVLPGLPSEVPSEPALILAQIGQETFVGVFLGACVRILFLALTTAGQIIGQTIALSNIFVLPGSGFDAGSVVGTFLTVSGLAFFFIADLHHDALRTLAESYAFLPVGSAIDVGAIGETVARTVNGAFTLGVELSGPFLVLGFVFYVGVGLINKMMVSLPVFFISMPIGIMGGIAVLSTLSGLMLLRFADSIGLWFDTFPG